MKKLLLLLIFFSVVAFAAWKEIFPASFTVVTKVGKKVSVADLRYTPMFGIDSLDSLEEFTLHNDIGHFDVAKDLREVERIDVLDEKGWNLKVTYPSGHSLEGSRVHDTKLDEDPSDYIEGKSGRVRVMISVREIVSITRD